MVATICSDTGRVGRTLAGLGVLASILLGWSGAPPPVRAAEEAVSAEAARIARGGRLYDKWYAVIDAEKPAGTHPAWPAANTEKQGATTWRCKSCHGWDYLGAGGAYATGSYETGIVGVLGMAGADPAAVVALLEDDTHRYDGLMDARDFEDLALFVTEGLIEMDRYVDREDGTVRGDPVRGRVYYETLCIACHGATGTKVKDMEPLGELMARNPWEVLHKIVFGQPAEEMPALVAFDLRVTADLMAYAATLPKEK